VRRHLGEGRTLNQEPLAHEVRQVGRTDTIVVVIVLIVHRAREELGLLPRGTHSDQAIRTSGGDSNNSVVHSRLQTPEDARGAARTDRPREKTGGPQKRRPRTHKQTILFSQTETDPQKTQGSTFPKRILPVNPLCRYLQETFTPAIHQQGSSTNGQIDSSTEARPAPGDQTA